MANEKTAEEAIDETVDDLRNRVMQMMVQFFQSDDYRSRSPDCINDDAWCNGLPSLVAFRVAAQAAGVFLDQCANTVETPIELLMRIDIEKGRDAGRAIIRMAEAQVAKDEGGVASSAPELSSDELAAMRAYSSPYKA